MRTVSAATHHQAVDFNIFEGMNCHGVTQYTISRGVVVWEKGNLNVEAGSGRFISLRRNCDYVFSAVRQREQVCSHLRCVYDIHDHRLYTLSRSCEMAMRTKRREISTESAFVKSKHV